MNDSERYFGSDGRQEKIEDSCLCSPEDNVTRIGVVEEEDDDTNSTSRFDSDCIYLAMQDGLTESRIILEEHNNSSQKNRINADNEVVQIKQYCNHLSQENHLLRIRNDALLNEISIQRRNMQSQIDQIQQQVELRVLKQKEIYQRSLEVKDHQYFSEIQTHQAVERELKSQIKKLKNELEIVKKNHEVSALLQKGIKKNGKANQLAVNPPNEASLAGNDSNTSSFSHHLAGIRSKQHTALKENTRILNSNQYGNNENYGSFKGSLEKLPMRAHLRSESVDLSCSKVNQFQDYTITFKEEQSQENLRQQLHNSNKNENQRMQSVSEKERCSPRKKNNKGSQMLADKIEKPSQIGAAAGAADAVSMKWKDHNFKLTRLSQQITNDNQNSNILSYPFSIDFEIPINSIVVPNNSCIQLDKEEQEVRQSGSSRHQLVKKSRVDLEECNPIMTLSATSNYNDEVFHKYKEEKQLNLPQEYSANYEINSYKIQPGKQSKNDSSLSRVKNYQNSLLFIQRACSLGPSRKNSFQVDDSSNLLSLNSSKTRKGSVSLQQGKNNSKNNHNLLRFRSNSFAISSSSMPCQSLSNSYMKQTQSSKQKQTAFKN